jgi:ketosteroid isomerase-like protein
VAENYRELFSSMRDVRSQGLQRFATEDRDSRLTFEIAKAGYWPYPEGKKIEMRLVHIFEMRDGQIVKEPVYDMGRRVESKAA